MWIETDKLHNVKYRLITETGHRRLENMSAISSDTSEQKSEISRLRRKSIPPNIVIHWSGQLVGELLGKFQQFSK